MEVWTMDIEVSGELSGIFEALIQCPCLKQR